MASVDEHINRWKQFREAATSLIGLDASLQHLRDWVVVVRFYAAVHLTEAYMRTKDERFWSNTDHNSRRKAIRLSTELGSRFESAFSTLKDISERLRYQPNLPIVDSDHNAAKESLERVESFLVSKLKSKGFTL